MAEESQKTFLKKGNFYPKNKTQLAWTGVSLFFCSEEKPYFVFLNTKNPLTGIKLIPTNEQIFEVLRQNLGEAEFYF